MMASEPNPTSPCQTCELVARRDRGAAPVWDRILRTRYWDLAHAYNSALPGYLVLVARRHVAAIHDLSEDEAVELGRLLRAASIALQQVTGCLKTYVMQFAEHPDHRHVHFHIVPRMADQPADRHSVKAIAYLNGPEQERVAEEKMNEIAAGIQRVLRAELEA